MDMAEVLAEAKRRGYTVNFAFEDNRLCCTETGDRFAADEAQLVDSQPVDTGTDPGDDATLYFIETGDGRKGFLMVADSFHADPQKAAFIDRLLRRRAEGDAAEPE